MALNLDLDFRLGFLKLKYATESSGGFVKIWEGLDCWAPTSESDLVGPAWSLRSFILNRFSSDAGIESQGSHRDLDQHYPKEIK